jgi:hypothetical protein
LSCLSVVGPFCCVPTPPASHSGSAKPPGIYLIV